MSDNQKPKSIFQKIRELSHEAVDTYMSDLKKSNPTMTQSNYGGAHPSVMRHTWGKDLEKEWSDYGYKPKLTLLTDNHKLLIYLKNPIVGAIVQCRVTQLEAFCMPQKNKWDAGFFWEKKDGTELTEDEKPTQKMLNDFVVNCGLVDEEREDADELMSFSQFMKLAVKDSLIYDHLSLEFVPGKNGKVHHWLPVSGATMRLLAPNFKDATINNNDAYGQLKKPMDQEKLAAGKYKFGQVVNGQLRKVFTSDEIVLEFRNPINDFFTGGYPVSELDLLMNTISAHINAENYNRSIFTHGMTSEGIINLKGEVDDEQLKAMRRSWYSQGIGPDAMFKTPILNAPEGVEFIKLNTNHKDLEYSNYINYLIKVICAIYQISPEEIGFDTGGKSDGASGNSQNYNNVEKKLQYSKDKGLIPLLKFMEYIINEKILPRFSKELYKKYRFRFGGLADETRMDEIDRLKEETMIYKTLNEAREEQGLEPIEGADIILNGSFIQWFMQFSPEAKKMNEEMMQQEQAAPGGEDQGDGSSGGGDVEYVDENGDPVDPSTIDENMAFEDEEGRPVDKDGNPLDGSTSEEGEDTDKLPFEDDEETPEEAKVEDKSKLPFEE